MPDVGVKRCGAVADLADLAGTRRGEVPGIPGGGEHVLATEQDTPDGIIGTADLRVKRGHASTALRSGRRVDLAAVGALELHAIGVLGGFRIGVLSVNE